MTVRVIFVELEQSVANPLFSFDEPKRVSSSAKRNAFATLWNEYIADTETTRANGKQCPFYNPQKNTQPYI